MWSTTLFTYGDDFRQFAIQLVFCYDEKLTFSAGNSYLAMTIRADDILERAEEADWPIQPVKDGAYQMIKSPAGYRFFIINKPAPLQGPIQKVHLKCTDETVVLAFWHCILGAKCLSHKSDHSVVVSFQDYGIKLKFRKTSGPLSVASHGCRLTVSALVEELKELEKFLNTKTYDISLPLTMVEVSEDNSVLAMIVNDFDGHEVMLCDDVAYDLASELDPTAEQLLTNAIRNELVCRGRLPIVDENDALLYKFLNVFERNEKCRRQRSFRILGPLRSLPPRHSRLLSSEQL